MQTPIDNFSQNADGYAAFRPGSPDALLDFLYGHVKSFDTAWDCGTGNGQVAAKLADRFGTVYATDISERQLLLAPAKKNIVYRKERAEQTSIGDHSVDLITVAQAIHWFDFGGFYKEVQRVGRAGAVIAVWTYTLIKISPEADQVIAHLYEDITHPYWDKQRSYVDAGYGTIPFPFKEIPAPDFVIQKPLTLAQLAGYLSTWSGVQHYMEKQKQDPVAMILPELQKAWGKAEKLQVTWPVKLRAGIIAAAP